MSRKSLFDEMSQKFSELLANSPARDIEKNAKALMNSAFDKLDLVTEQEFELQTEMLAHTREKVEALEARIVALEAEIARLKDAG